MTQGSSHTFTISATQPTRAGYTFDGWTTNSAGTGTLYQPGGSITISANTTLYAKWTAEPLEITSTQGDTTISTGTAFSYNVTTNLTGCTVSVSGADWISASGSTVYGTPTEAGDYNITVTVSKSGYSSVTQQFTIHVVSSLGFTSVPSNGLIVVEV